MKMLTQGVTTEIINADGAGSLNLTQQLTNFSAEGLVVNLGAYVGFNAMWASVVGNSEDARLADREFEAGRLGR